MGSPELAAMQPMLSRFLAVCCVVLMIPGSNAQASRRLLCGDEICSSTAFPAAKGTGWQKTGSDKGKFCLNNAPLDRETLGHVSWSFLHTTAAYLPQGTLSAQKKAAFLGLIHSIDQIYACALCRGHFQKLMKEDPLVSRELSQIESNEDASLWLWKVHNMVTLAQHPGTKLFLNGLDQPSAGAPVVNQTALQLALAPAFVQNSTTQIRLSELTGRARAMVYDAILQRWRAAGGRVAVPSMYAPEFPPSSQAKVKQLMRKLRNESSGPKLRLKQCDPARQQLAKADKTGQLAMCPNLHKKRSSSKPELLIFTMGRCPYCAATMEQLYPLLSGELWRHLTFKNKYILQQVPGKATSMLDFISLHGDGETVADSYELCAQYLHPQSIKWYQFVRCQDETFWAAGYNAGLGHGPRNCSRKAGLDWDSLHKCATGATGLRLLSESVHQTKQHNVSGAPTMIFAGHTTVGMPSPTSMRDAVCLTIACDEQQAQATQDDAVFAPATSLYSESAQDAYRTMMAGTQSVDPAARATMLSTVRLNLGITEEDHHRAMQLLKTSDEPSNNAASSSSTSLVIPLTGVGLCLAVVLGVVLVVRKLRSTNDSYEEATFSRVPNFVSYSQDSEVHKEMTHL